MSPISPTPISPINEAIVPTSADSRLDDVARERIAKRLQRIYGDAGEACVTQVLDCVDRFVDRLPDATERTWDASDIVLITYGDQVQQSGQTPLAALRQFLVQGGLDELLSTVHLLPFYPYSSDDGFSVIDYRAVNPTLGSWDDVAALGEDFRLAFDLVLNHMSSQSEWFAAYLRGEEPYDRFFVEADPAADLSDVVRPRNLPLLTPVETSRGTRHVWTTFSADQVDLNFAEPVVLVAMLEVLLDYVARGAQLIRLDAIAFLWKEIGTSCVHLAETHEVVKLMRDVLQAVVPHVWLLTETNVPHHENVSYFGDGDEAQMVYQFSLPPLLVDAFTFGDASRLMRWLRDLEPTRPGTTYFNFTASHDGVGLRPLEGLAPSEQIERLVEAMRQRGGLVSSRRREDGVEVLYEINISYVDALAPAGGENVELHARRFLASQALMLAQRGVPAVYFHSLVGTLNDTHGAHQSGHPRRINRRKFQRAELDAQTADADSLSGCIYAGYRNLLRVRRCQGAFHPEATQTAVDTGRREVISFLRHCDKSLQTVLVLANVGEVTIEVDVSPWLAAAEVIDLIDGQKWAESATIQLLPGQARWLTTAD